MAKTFKLGDIIGIERKPLKTPKLDAEGQMIEGDKGRAVLKDATLVDVFNELIRYFPKERLSMENIIHGAKLKDQLLNCKNGTLIIEDAEYKWVDGMLKDEAVGPKIFGFNLVAIQAAADAFGRLHEPKEAKAEPKEVTAEPKEAKAKK